VARSEVLTPLAWRSWLGVGYPRQINSNLDDQLFPCQMFFQQARDFVDAEEQQIHKPFLRFRESALIAKKPTAKFPWAIRQPRLGR
jgi:hypothetical protein